MRSPHTHPSGSKTTGLSLFRHSLHHASNVNRTTHNALHVILFLIISLSLPAGAAGRFDIHPTKKIEANPLNVAFILAQETDSAKMSSILRYYGYVPASDDSSLKTQDLRLKTYTHPNGSIIRFSLTTNANGRKYPAIEVKSKDTQKEKTRILENLNFHKNGNTYERGSIEYNILCTSAPQGYLRLTGIPKSR